MRLPIPNAAEVDRFIALHEADTGSKIAREDAYDALTRIAQFIYLTEYEPVRALRPQEPSGSFLYRRH